VLERKFAFEMSDRLKALCGISESTCHGEAECAALCSSHYSQLTENDFSNLSAMYGADMIIRRDGKSLNFQKLYENGKYSVYRAPRAVR
jgi:hypothetical protein